MIFYELNLAMESVHKVEGVTAVKQENGAYLLNGSKYISAKKVNSFTTFLLEGMWLMPFDDDFKCNNAMVFNAFMDIIIAKKEKEVGVLEQDHRVRVGQVERKIQYFESLKK